ncbi:unknown [Firmicutes bacterium CAG:822]|nr:unknown [Firmicutes bacterium CAG:822]
MKKLNKENIISFIKKYKLYLIIFLVVVVALIIGLIISLGFDKEEISVAEEPGIVANTSEEVVKEETYEGLQFSNISLITENGYTTFTADVTNTTETDSTISDVDIILQDKDGNEVITLRGNIGEPLKSNETRTITAVTKGNLKNVTAKVIAEYEKTAQN